MSLGAVQRMRPERDETRAWSRWSRRMFPNRGIGRPRR